MLGQRPILGYTDAKILQRTVFYVGLHFLLRGVDEQRSLVPSQIVRYPTEISAYNEDVYYEYTEFISKNNQHRFKDINSLNKHVRVYATPGNNTCVIRLLDLYFSKLPSSPPAFYLRPLSTCGSWYGLARVGVNMLKKFIPDLCKEASLLVHYTNHSL